MPIKPAPSLWRNPLRLGMTKGHDVAAWQEVQRSERPPRDWTHTWPLVVDGFFGPMTEKVTKSFQERRGLLPDGIVGPVTRAAIDPSLFADPIPLPDTGLPNITFTQARYWKHADRTAIDNIVMHSAESGEFLTSAEAIGSYFHIGPRRPSSAHLIVDCDSIVRCVRDEDIAFHAPPNDRSIGIEQAGYAKQTRQEWLDDYGQKMLRLVARLVKFEARRWGVPLVWLTPEELRIGARGLCTHHDVTLAFGQTTHTDPGPGYPKDVVLEWAKAGT